jgi:hypothetical protein
MMKSKRFHLLCQYSLKPRAAIFSTASKMKIDVNARLM